MTRFIVWFALLAGGCHTTVYRVEGEPVRIFVVRRAPAATPRRPGVSTEQTGPVEPRFQLPAPPPAPGARP